MGDFCLTGLNPVRTGLRDPHEVNSSVCVVEVGQVEGRDPTLQSEAEAWFLHKLNEIISFAVSVGVRCWVPKRVVDIAIHANEDVVSAVWWGALEELTEGLEFVELLWGSVGTDHCEGVLC